MRKVLRLKRVSVVLGILLVGALALIGILSITRGTPVKAVVAIGDAVTVRLEQLYRLARLRQLKDFGKHARHVPFVIFVRPIDVEKFQPDPMRRHFFFLHAPIDHRKVEQVLAPSVKIHRLEVSQGRKRPVVVEPLAAIAISRG